MRKSTVLRFRKRQIIPAQEMWMLPAQIQWQAKQTERVSYSGNRAEKVILLRNRMNRRAILYFRIQHLREAERQTKQIILERVRSADLSMKLLQGRMRKDL